MRKASCFNDAGKAGVRREEKAIASLMVMVKASEDADGRGVEYPTVLSVNLTRLMTTKIEACCAA